ncbi:MAG: VOC family protein [Deltaproteobacteria bacterium]|nr:VOC family protein [Deltaproteobacteria bacterium]
MGAPSIHHLALRTRNMERLAGFYEHVFGLPRLRETPGHSIWLGLNGGVLMVEQADGDEPEIPRESFELFAFACTAEERAALKARLPDLGLRTDGETEHTLYLRDPDGRRVGLSSYPLSR